MKIGILTFHRASNYGAVLQTYAINKIIKSLGADVSIVDYRCQEVEESHLPKYLIKRRGLIKGIIHLPAKIMKFMCFEGFRKRHIITTKKYSRLNIKETAAEFDKFIVGSDQVWNDKLSGFDTSYLLDFANPVQKYSYACSFGFSVFPDIYKKKYLELLKDFRCISVREMSGKNLLAENNLTARVDLDPTLLLSESEWKKLEQKPQIDKKYILIYTVNLPVKLLDVARELSKRTGLQIVYLNNEHLANRDIYHKRYSSPEEFIGFFSNAEYILTNSFHGTAFSIIFKKKFLVELNTRIKFNLRSRDFLYECGLEQCILQDNFDISTFQNVINWDTVYAHIENLRKQSLTYLKKIIYDI